MELNKLTKELKESVINTYKKIGENNAIHSCKQYTGNEVASEIENETEFGVNILSSLIKLSIELVKRQKETLEINKNK